VDKNLFLEVKFKPVGALEFASRHLWIHTQARILTFLLFLRCVIKPSGSLECPEKVLAAATSLQKAMKMLLQFFILAVLSINLCGEMVMTRFAMPTSQYLSSL
jgi:hypothetical protein